MLPASIESSPNYQALTRGSHAGSSERSASPLPRMPRRGRARSTRRPAHRCCGCCAALGMWLVNCFRSSTSVQEQQLRVGRPAVLVPEGGAGRYQAPVVTPSPRAGSTSSCDEDQDLERGTLLPKRRTPEPGSLISGGAASSRGAGAASSAAAAAAVSSEAAGGAAAAPSPPPMAAAVAATAAAPAAGQGDAASRHRRTGSDGPRTHGEGVRARATPAAAAVAAVAAAAAGSKPSKLGTVSAAEFTAVAELLGVDGDDEDFCPTCLEAYTDDDPKIFTRCGHAFHMQCIFAWLERKSTCPLCESPMDVQDDVLL